MALKDMAAGGRVRPRVKSQFCCVMIISHKNRFIFLKTRKVGGSSVELTLSKFCGKDDILTPLAEEASRADTVGARNYRLPYRQWPMAGKVRRLVGSRITPRRSGYYDHISAAEVRRFAGPAVFDSYFKFSIERNPWDRQVSQYYWETKACKSRPSFSAYLHGKWKHKRIPNWSIYTIDDEVCVDHVIQYSDLSSEFLSTLHRMGLDEPVELQSAKRGIREKSSYQDLYDPTTKDIVAGWYEKEIERFGYTF